MVFHHKIEKHVINKEKRYTYNRYAAHSYYIFLKIIETY
jgi:hypothetical protein